MRLVSYGTESSRRCGIQIGDTVYDASAVAQAAGLALDYQSTDWSKTKEVIASDDHALRLLEITAKGIQQSRINDGMALALHNVRLGPPIPDPEKIICLGLNYRDHAKEANLPPPQAPMLFAKFRNSLIGPFDDIELPYANEKVDYEAELAVVIGRRAKCVSKRGALQCIFGAMAMNDVSARDVQLATSQWMAGKAIDTFAPCGPAVVSRDELGDIQNLAIQTRVNGKLVQNGNTKNMIFGVSYIVSYLSQLMTLEPGDIIATGTPAGVGFKRQPPVLLKDGDVVEVEIERIGRLANPVHDRNRVGLQRSDVNQIRAEEGIK
ncbi:MAG TPA: fumarylacetoacetate hydrolase family protein [Chthoniobacterales bacterium]|nr:fumarylacetoacetate hydrolase family protein [Chthoniobacterales bacterium]